MTARKERRWLRPRFLACVAVCLCIAAPQIANARPRVRPLSRPSTSPTPATQKEEGLKDDTLNRKPAKDLLLRTEGEHMAYALANFVQGLSFEESGELVKALAAYRRVLNVDPGQSELACRVAAMLARQEDYPEAIDVLKDTIKANPTAPKPFLQLALIYAKYLKRNEQAIDYVNHAIALDPKNIEAYERLCEIAIAAGDEKKALQALERATKVNSDDGEFWTRLGKLYAATTFKPGMTASAQQIAQINQIFKKASEHADNNPAVLKDIADYYAASNQLKEAIRVYLRLLELQPDDTSAREKLADEFLVTNQREKALQMLEEIIKQHPEKYEPYDLLAGLLDDAGRKLIRENQASKAKTMFTKAAANYEQSILINPMRPSTYMHLAEILLGPLKESERAMKILNEARQRFPDIPEVVYYLAIAQRESKHVQQAVATFEEALHEAELDDAEMANARFYFDYGIAAEEAGLYDKAAGLLKKSIALDPENAADVYNYLAYMWADHNAHLGEARDMIERALQLEPDNGAYIDTLGWVEFRQGEFEQALRDLLRAKEKMAQDDPVVFEHIGDTYDKLNQGAQALDAWQKALALDPKNKRLAEKIDRAKTNSSKNQVAHGSPTHS